MNSFYTIDELKQLGLKSFGENVLISRKCSIYGAENISVGNNVRIDDFCILSGNIALGNYVHIAAYSALYGKSGIIIGDFCGVSARTTIFSQTDDFSGEFMISPMVPENLTNVIQKEVFLENYVQLGANTIVMPGVRIKEGAISGAFSFIKQDLKAWTINVGIPAKPIANRSKKLLELKEQIINI